MPEPNSAYLHACVEQPSVWYLGPLHTASKGRRMAVQDVHDPRIHLGSRIYVFLASMLHLLTSTLRSPDSQNQNFGPTGPLEDPCSFWLNSITSNP